MAFCSGTWLLCVVGSFHSKAYCFLYFFLATFCSKNMDLKEFKWSLPHWNSTLADVLHLLPFQKADVLHLLSVQAWLTACHVFFLFRSGVSSLTGWLDIQVACIFGTMRWTNGNMNQNGPMKSQWCSLGQPFITRWYTTCTALMYNVEIKKDLHVLLSLFCHQFLWCYAYVL